MVLQGDDDGHEGRDGRRRGLPSEASGGRYATHCWALTRPLGRLGRHRLVSGGAIAQQWLVQELREHLVGHHLLRRAREPRPLRLPLLLLLLLLLLPLPLLLLLRGPVATGANGMRRRALRRRRATATRTGQCIGTLLFQRRSSHYHSIDDYTVKQRLRTSVSIRGHAAGVTDRGEDVRAPFGYRSEGER